MCQHLNHAVHICTCPLDSPRLCPAAVSSVGVQATGTGQSQADTFGTAKAAAPDGSTATVLTTGTGQAKGAPGASTDPMGGRWGRGVTCLKSCNAEWRELAAPHPAFLLPRPTAAAATSDSSARSDAAAGTTTADSHSVVNNMAAIVNGQGWPPLWHARADHR